MRLIIFLIFLPVIFSCNSGNDKVGKVQPGIVTDHIESVDDPSVTYSAYLPHDYSEDSLFPIIIAFDPQGSGSLPIAMYKDLAEKYGYILVCSDNSKNGLNGNELMGIIHSTLNDVKKRFTIDTTRIYTMGFSGGARVAVMAALYPGGIASVTGSGAGFPNTGSTTDYRFDYLGLAGTSDFNMHEMVMLDEHLEKSDIHHGLILFEGKHEWPPSQVMERAFLWNDFNSMRSKNIPTNNVRITFFKKIQDSLIGLLREEGDMISLDRELKNTVEFLDKLSDVESYKKTLTELESSAEYKTAAEKMKKTQLTELSEQSLLQENFFSKDTNWWKDKLVRWEKVIRSGNDEDEKLMINRMKSYLSLISYMNYTRAREAREANTSAHAMWIYNKVDPEHAAQTRDDK